MNPKEIREAYESEIVKDLRPLMREFFDREEFGMWLALPQQLLDNRSPLELIHEGEGDKVLASARSISKGSYL